MSRSTTCVVGLACIWLTISIGACRTKPSVITDTAEPIEEQICGDNELGTRTMLKLSEVDGVACLTQSDLVITCRVWKPLLDATTREPYDAPCAGVEGPTPFTDLATGDCYRLDIACFDVVANDPRLGDCSLSTNPNCCAQRDVAGAPCPLE